MTGTTLASLWADAVRDRGPQPFLTHYDLATGERVELSHTTTDNWVSKTANLTEEIGLGAGDQCCIDLPLHWQSAVWALAAWRVGLDIADVAATVVTTPDRLPAHDGPLDGLVVCSLRPMGLPCEGPLPPHAVDYALEVRSQGDRFVGPPVTPADAAVGGDSHADVLARARDEAGGPSGAIPSGARLLVAEPVGHHDVLRPLALALAVGGSLVLVRAADASAVDRVAADERVTLLLPPAGAATGWG